jgi:hypothetical protein
MTEDHRRKRGDLTFWKGLDGRLKIAAAIVGSLVTIGGALWAGGMAASHFAGIALERTFATKSDLVGCATSAKEYHDSDMKTHMSWSAEHDQVLVMKAVDATVDRLKRERFLIHRNDRGDGQ